MEVVAKDGQVKQNEVTVWKTVLLGIVEKEDKIILSVERHYSNGAVDKNSDLAPMSKEEFLTLSSTLKEEFGKRNETMDAELEKLRIMYEDAKKEIEAQIGIVDNFINTLKEKEDGSNS